MRLMCFTLCLAIQIFFVGRSAPSGDAQNLADVYRGGNCRLVPNLRISGEDIAEEKLVLYMPTAIAVSRDGRIFVLDARQSAVLVFGPDGEFIRSFGREGEGPGELSRAMRMTIDSSGRLVVHERGNRRFSYFTLDGEYLHTRKFQQDVSRFSIDRNGEYVIEIEEIRYTSAGPETHVSLVRYDSSLRRECTLDSVRVNKWKMFDSGEGVTSITLPYYEELLWAADTDGTVYSGCNCRYEIHISEKCEAGPITLRRTVEAARVTPEERSDYFSRFDRYGAGFVVKLKRQVKVPSHKPFYSAITIDNEHNILVLRARAEGVSTVDVFSPSGEFVGEIALRIPHHSPLFVDGAVYCLEFKSEEPPSIVRGTIQ